MGILLLRPLCVTMLLGAEKCGGSVYSLGDAEAMELDSTRLAQQPRLPRRDFKIRSPGNSERKEENC